MAQQLRGLTAGTAVVACDVLKELVEPKNVPWSF